MSGDDGILNSCAFDSETFGSVDMVACEDFSPVEQVWAELEKCKPGTLYQRYDWVKAWTTTLGETTGLRSRIVVASVNGEPLFLLPLAMRKAGPLKLVEWLADSHSNFQMGLFSEWFSQQINSAEMMQIMTTVADLLGGIDLFSLRFQPASLLGQHNPLAKLPGHKSSNPAFALDMSGGFDATLERISGAKRRKKHRWQVKQLGDENRIFLRVAATQQDVEHILDAAFAQMATRFAKLGITNVFADKHTQLFFHNLALQSVDNSQPTSRLYALEIDGEIRAALSGGVNGDHFSACFISLAEDEFSYLSPGQLLIYRVLEDCAACGITSFDFGRGEERYKRSWTDQEIDMIDVTLPFTAAGKSLAALQRGKSEAKRLVRNNETLWGFVKQVRARFKQAG